MLRLGILLIVAAGLCDVLASPMQAVLQTTVKGTSKLLLGFGDLISIIIQRAQATPRSISPHNRYTSRSLLSRTHVPEDRLPQGEGEEI